MKTPRVSVLMGAYNRAHFINRAVEGLQKQSFEDWEMVITDDGSADATPEVAGAWPQKDPRIVYLRHDQNVGISVNYNRGFAHTRGEYIAMLDDDDVWSDQDKLCKQVEFLDRNREYAGCGGGLIVVWPDGRERYRYLKPESDADIRKHMLFSNPMANSTTLFRREAGERVGWYDATMRYSGDRDFWLKIGLIGKLFNFPEYFSYYTMGDNNTSILHMRPHLKASLEIMKRYKGSIPRSIGIRSFRSP
jgi:glycosyltransferase involved in cell wall biosynthesis